MKKSRYDRARDLPSLIPLWPHELEISSAQEHERLLHRLRRALRAERQRGIAGHWCYNLMRHASLLAAYRLEQDLFLASWGYPCRTCRPQ